MNEWMNENLYIAHKKTSTQNLACSQRQIHTLHTCKLSQAKTTKGHSYQKVQTALAYPPTPSIYFLIPILILSRRFLTEFSVHANIMLGGKLFQLFITLLPVSVIIIIIAYWLDVRKNCLLVSLERVSFCFSRSVQLEQGTSGFSIIKTMYDFKSLNDITSIFQAW